MTYKCDFNCNGCAEDFTAEWSFGDEVTCTHCGRVFETDWETNSDDDIQGPWLAKEISGPTKSPPHLRSTT